MYGTLGTKHDGFSAVEIIIICLVVAVIGAAGFLAFKKSSSTKSATTPTTEEQLKTGIDDTATPAKSAVDPYAGWKTYSSPTEKVRFKHPSDWTSVDYGDRTATGKADSVQLFSPSKQVTVYWSSQEGGKGGACDSNVFPGSAEAQNSPLGACPYFKVLDKQELAGANLYYVAGVRTRDGKVYSPWLALQNDQGLLSSRGNTGYLSFPGKNNSYSDAEDRTIEANAKLIAGRSDLPPFGDGNGGTLNESEAARFFSTDEAQQAKLILMSATY